MSEEVERHRHEREVGGSHAVTPLELLFDLVFVFALTQVTSLLADLSKLAARRFLLGPIANALSGALGGAGGIFASIMHTGGMVGATGAGRMVPALAFAGAPRMHAGGMVGLRHDEVPAILQRGERVLSRREAQDHGKGVTVNIHARDAESFRQSRTQIAADIARAVSLGRRGL